MDDPGRDGGPGTLAAIMESLNLLTTRSRDSNRKDPVQVRLGDRSCVNDLKSSTRILLLVHGFANSESQAQVSYRAFQDKLAAALGTPLTSGMVWEFHWPGGFDEGKLASLVRYPGRVPVAGWSGDKLAQFLHYDKRVGKHQQLYIVAHSLGCRVILETILRIQEEFGDTYNGPAITDVALLAAAVSTFDCLPRGGRYQQLPDTREYVFFSNRDKALKPAFFGIGQRIFGDRGRAVGRTGMPDSRWDGRAPTCLDHSDYWRNPLIAEAIAKILGSGPVELPRYCLPEEMNDSAAPLQSRGLPEDPLPVRA